MKSDFKWGACGLGCYVPAKDFSSPNLTLEEGWVSDRPGDDAIHLHS